MKNESIDGTHVRMTAILPSEKVDLTRWRIVSIEFNQPEKVRWLRRHASIESVSHVDGKSSKSTSHRAQTSPDHGNPGHVFFTRTWMN